MSSDARSFWHISDQKFELHSDTEGVLGDPWVQRYCSMALLPRAALNIHARSLDLADGQDVSGSGGVCDSGGHQDHGASESDHAVVPPTVYSAIFEDSTNEFIPLMNPDNLAYIRSQNVVMNAAPGVIGKKKKPPGQNGDCSKLSRRKR